MTAFVLSDAEVEDHITKCYLPGRRVDVFQHIAGTPNRALSLVFYACALGYNEAFDDLIARGFKYADGWRDWKGRTLYHLAAQRQYPKIMTRLIELGADPLTVDREGYDPFYSAMTNNHRITSNMIETLLKCCPAYVHNSSSQFRITCLHYGHMPAHCMRILLEAGAWKVVNLFCFYGERKSGTVVDYICDRGHDEYRLDQLAVLVAWGGRRSTHALPHHYEAHPDYITVMARLQSCARAAVIVMGLAKLRSSVARGNGRDALRLVARMVWVYRVDEEWDVGRVESKSKKQ